MATDKETIAKAPQARVKRIPIGTRNILTVKGKDPNYVYRIVNDDGDRIEAFKDAGYTLVEAADVRVGDKRVNSTSPEGTHAKVSVGGGQKAYVMRILKEFYDEDQAAKMAEVKRQEDAIKQQPSSDYGGVKITHN